MSREVALHHQLHQSPGVAASTFWIIIRLTWPVFLEEKNVIQEEDILGQNELITEYGR